MSSLSTVLQRAARLPPFFAAQQPAWRRRAVALQRPRSLMSSATSPAVVVYVTTPNIEVATALSRALVRSQLAACVNIVPGVRSIYSWQGEVCEDNEHLLVVKSRAELVGKLTEAVRALHPYDTPEIVALPITDGSAEYLAWLHESTTGADVAVALAAKGEPLRS